MGKKVQTLVNKFHTPGNYKISFDAGILNSGIYIYKISTSENSVVKKMTLIK